MFYLDGSSGVQSLMSHSSLRLKRLPVTVTVLQIDQTWPEVSIKIYGSVTGTLTSPDCESSARCSLLCQPTNISVGIAEPFLCHRKEFILQLPALRAWEKGIRRTLRGKTKTGLGEMEGGGVGGVRERVRKEESHKTKDRQSQKKWLFLQSRLDCGAWNPCRLHS